VRDFFETWYEMSVFTQSGLDISPVITHRFPYTQFEQAFAHYCGVRHAIAVSSGTAAIHLALIASGCSPSSSTSTAARTRPSGGGISTCGGLTPEELVDGLPTKMPNWAAEKMFNACRDLNHFLFRSKPPGPPVAADPSAFKFAVIGDYGSGSKPLADVTGNIARDNPNLVLTVGDNVYYNGTEAEYQTKWDPNNAFGAIRTNFPVLPSLGNHDARVSTDPYFKRFPELDRARYYSFDDHGVHFVALNTNEAIDPTSSQYQWLEKDLAASKDDWKVLYFHHPMISGYPKNTGPLKAALGPLIAKYGVDLIFAGHEHNYQRSKPIDAAGAVEIVTGGGGQTLHPFVTRQSAETSYRDVDFGHVEVEVHGK